MGDQAKKEASNQSSEKEKEKEKGGLRKLIKAAGQKSVAATGTVAGSALSGLGSVAGAASHQAKLLRAPTIDPHHIPTKFLPELAQAFADWLQAENEGLVELETLSTQPANEQFLLKLKEKERSSKISLFLFASAVTEELRQREELIWSFRPEQREVTWYNRPSCSDHPHLYK